MKKNHITGVVTALTFAVFFGASLGYSNPASTSRVLADDGYTDVVITGRQYFGCDRDFYRTTFTAKNSRGIKVHGVVCQGLISGAATIRRL